MRKLLLETEDEDDKKISNSSEIIQEEPDDNDFSFEDPDGFNGDDAQEGPDNYSDTEVTVVHCTNP